MGGWIRCLKRCGRLATVGLAGVVAVAGPLPAGAYDAASAANVFSHEVLTCVAYYTLVAGEKRQAGESMEAYKHFVVAASMLKRAQALVPISRAQEKLDQITARMTDRLEEGGSSVVLDREYESICRSLDASPAARLKYWMDKR